MGPVGAKEEDGMPGTTDSDEVYSDRQDSDDSDSDNQALKTSRDQTMVYQRDVPFPITRMSSYSLFLFMVPMTWMSSY